MTSRAVVAAGVGALALYALAWPLARHYDASVDQLRPLYGDRQQVAELLYEQVESRGGEVQSQSISADPTTALSEVLTAGATAQVQRQGSLWCLRVEHQDGFATEWRCYEDGEDPAETAGDEPADEPGGSYLELDLR